MAKLNIVGTCLDYSQDGWAEFVKWIDGTRASSAYAWTDEGPAYTVLAFDGGFQRVCSFNKGTPDAEAFEASYKNRVSAPVVPRTSRGSSRLAVEKPDSPKVTLYSHDWCNPTTWYEAAIRVVDETPAQGDGHLQLAHPNVIDAYHGKITGETFLTDPEDHPYRVAVKVSGVAKTEQDPHVGSGGDFVVDYPQGRITWIGEAPDAADVAVTYHYATTSVFTVRPTPGRVLVLDFVEAQFSEDVIITDSVVFQPHGFVDYFAPYLMAPPYNIPSGTKIPLGNPLIYKTMRDFYNDAVKSYPEYPPLGGDGWRGIAVKTVCLDWDYVRATPVSSAAGMEICIKLEHDQPFGGSFATATLYGSSEPE